MAWLDEIPIELQRKWFAMKSRISALIDDLGLMAEAKMPLSGTPENAFRWAEIEKQNLIRFGEEASPHVSTFDFTFSGGLRGDINRATDDINAAIPPAVAGQRRMVGGDFDSGLDSEPGILQTLTDLFTGEGGDAPPPVEPSIVIGGFIAVLLVLAVVFR